MGSDITTVGPLRKGAFGIVVDACKAAAVSTTTKLQSVLSSTASDMAEACWSCCKAVVLKVFGLGTTPYCFPNSTLNLMFLGEAM